MREIIEALTTELRRLKANGVKSVNVSPESLAALRDVARARRGPSGERREAGEAAPPAIESGDGGRRPVVASSGVADVSARRFQSGDDGASPSKIGIASRSEINSDVAMEKPAQPTLPPAPVFTLPAGDKTTRMAWLCEKVLSDPVCRSRVRPGKKVVVGVGNLDAKIFFCGEAPGAEEEVQGEPFVGPAGQLLTRMIQAMGLRREDVYIGNIMNWRPDLPTPPGSEQFGNRPPTSEELTYCLPYLRAQLEVVDPQLIVALGTTAAQGLFGVGSFKALGEIRGRWKQFAEKPVMVTYHPSYILRNASNRSKRAIWEDLLKVMERVGLPVSEKQRGYFLDK